MPWHSTLQLIETCSCNGFVSGLGMKEVDLAPSASRWTDPDLRRFETKSGARGEFSWNG